jgi:hypothetical protein
VHKSEIEKKFDDMVRDIDSGKITGTSERVAIISSAALVMAINRLNRSSNVPWIVNLALTFIVLLLAVAQVCVALRGH